jgi:integrase
VAERTASCLLSDFCAKVFASRRIKASTLTAYLQAVRCLRDFFGDGCDLRQITPERAEAFRDALRSVGLREATVRRRCGVARDVFSAAIKLKLVNENPFSALPVSVRGSPDRAHLVEVADAEKLLSACPDGQWRVLIALARWGGCRIPSEALTLTWADVDWDRQTVRVHSPKTEHHAGGGSRVIPLFPELRRELSDLFAAETPAAEDYVVTRYRSPSSNLRTQLGRIARRAGVTLWPKPWINMRATRDAELRRDYPSHVVRQWIGHSERVAQEHYLLVPDESYIAQAAAGKASDAQSDCAQRCAGRCHGAPQNRRKI